MLMKLTIVMPDYRIAGYYDNADDLEAALDPLSNEPVPMEDIMRKIAGTWKRYYTQEGYAMPSGGLVRVPIVSLEVMRVDVNTTWEGLRYESD